MKRNIKVAQSLVFLAVVLTLLLPVFLFPNSHTLSLRIRVAIVVSALSPAFVLLWITGILEYIRQQLPPESRPM